MRRILPGTTPSTPPSQVDPSQHRCPNAGTVSPTSRSRYGRPSSRRAPASTHGRLTRCIHGLGRRALQCASWPINPALLLTPSSYVSSSYTLRYEYRPPVTHHLTFSTTVERPPSPPRILTSTDDLITQCGILSSYDDFVRPFIKTSAESHADADEKGKGKEVTSLSEQDPANPKKKRKFEHSYKSFLVDIPGPLPHAPNPPSGVQFD